ncbi:methyl-accepting chemotaxis protein [Leptospira sp. 96542]|nr:methyl-accepting chemotaxis protein [Leptospira sp. 96542]
MNQKKLIQKLTLAIEAPLYFLVFPYFINFCIFASDFNEKTLLTMAITGSVLSLIPLAIGVFFRYRRLNRLFSFFHSNEIPLYQIKKELLEHPRWEGRIILVRWSVSIFGFSIFAHYFLEIPWLSIIVLPYACIMMVPIIYLAFYFQTEVSLSPVLKDKNLSNVKLEESAIQIFGVFKRNLYTMIAVSLLPLMTFGYYLILILNFDFKSHYSLYQLPLVFLMMVVIIIYVSFVGSKSIKTDIDNINLSIETLSKGDLQTSVPQLSATNLSHTITKLNVFIGSLKEYFHTAKKESESLLFTSKTILAKGDTVENQVTSEKKILDTTLSSVHQIQELSKATYTRVLSQKQNTVYLVDELEKVNQDMTKLSQNATKLSKSTMDSVSTVLLAKDAIQSAYEKVENMNQMNEQIKSTISIVEDISDRVNLLSLNASIEAARAGNMGRGFAVVAGEVSRLADETAKNIEEIKRVVKLSQTASLESLVSMKDIIEKNDGVKFMFENISNTIEQFGKTSGVSSESVKSLRNLVQNFSNDANQITEEMKEQNHHTERSNGDLQNLWENHTKISETFSEISEEALRLKNISDSMEKIVSRFQF